MFNKVSMSSAGGLILIIETLLHMFDIVPADGSVAAVVNGLIAAIGILWAVWGALRRKDLLLGWFRA